MLPDPVAVAAALRLPPGTEVELEPLASTTSGTALASFPGTAALPEVLVRWHATRDESENHAAVLDALDRLSAPFAPRLLGLDDRLAVESVPSGGPLIATEVDDEQAEAVMEALAALHTLGLREGLRWERDPDALVPREELPLFRLGFTNEERVRAREPVLLLQEAARRSPAGFAHGRCVAANVFAGRGGVRIVDYASAGLGLQLEDVAAFLLTSGAQASLRRAMASSYARRRGLDPVLTADLVDGIGLLWGLYHLMDLPRSEILLLGDDAALAWVQLMARRVSQAIQDPAGEHPPAGALRRALWPQRT